MLQIITERSEIRIIKKCVSEGHAESTRNTLTIKKKVFSKHFFSIFFHLKIFFQKKSGKKSRFFFDFEKKLVSIDAKSKIIDLKKIEAKKRFFYF